MAAARDHRAGAADRVREPRQPDARACDRAPTRVRAAARPRRVARRLVSQSLTESLLLAVVGADARRRPRRRAEPHGRAVPDDKANGLHLDLGLDWRVLAFTAALAILTCLICGLAPALRSARAQPADVMKSGGRGLTGGPERFSFQRALVVSQVAVSLVLVIGALLFVRSFRNLLTADAGFRAGRAALSCSATCRVPTCRPNN